jgi:hypothetical protein
MKAVTGMSTDAARREEAGVREAKWKGEAWG